MSHSLSMHPSCNAIFTEVILSIWIVRMITVCICVPQRPTITYQRIGTLSLETSILLNDIGSVRWQSKSDIKWYRWKKGEGSAHWPYLQGRCTGWFHLCRLQTVNYQESLWEMKRTLEVISVCLWERLRQDTRMRWQWYPCLLCLLELLASWSAAPSRHQEGTVIETDTTSRRDVIYEWAIEWKSGSRDEWYCVCVCVCVFF